jgi:hypothetical protein
MPIYTVYAKIIRTGRKRHHVRNTVVLTFHERLVDWWDLKNRLRDAGRNIYCNHNQQTVTIITMEKHLGGRYIRAMKNYRETRTHYKRLREFQAKITYDPNPDTIKIESAVFVTPEFYQFKDDYDRERGKKWELKPLVEKGFEATLLNPQSINFNLLTVKNSIYDRPQQELYSSPQEQHHNFGSYTKISQGTYGPSNENTVERDSQERESQH